MSEGDRSDRSALVACVCTVVVFLIGLWAGGYHADRLQQDKPQGDRPNLSALQTSPESYEAICNTPVDKEYADLCQQWRSAQAAADGAKWAQGQLILGIVGVLGVGGTIFYARHTLIASRRIGQAQVRAYLVQDKIDIQWHHAEPDAVRNSALFQARWGNRGNSPALSCAFRTRLYVIRVEDIGMPVPEIEGEFDSMKAGSTDIGSGDDGSWSRAPRVLTPAEVDAWAEGRTGVILYSAAIYRDVFGKSVRIETCSQAHHVVDNGKNLVRFSTYPHHNSYEI